MLFDSDMLKRYSTRGDAGTDLPLAVNGAEEDVEDAGALESIGGVTRSAWAVASIRNSFKAALNFFSNSVGN